MPPTLLMVGNFMRAGAGARRTTDELAAHLAGAGWQVRSASRLWSRLPRLVDMLVQAARRPRPALAVVEVYSGPAFRWAEAVSRVTAWRGLPLVLVLHGGGLPEFSRGAPGRVRQLLARASAIVTPSPWLAGELRHLTPRPIRVIPNGMALAPYGHARGQARVPGLVLWMRGFHREYDPVLAVEVVACLPPEYRLVMLGGDERDGSLEETRLASERLGVTGRLEVRGPVPRAEVPVWLARADVLLNTSRTDNAPVSLAEAMAAGTPIVTTGPGGIPAMLDGGRLGLVVPDREPAALADGILRLAAEPGLRDAVVAAGLTCAARYDWEAVLPEWEGLIGELTRGHPG